MKTNSKLVKRGNFMFVVSRKDNVVTAKFAGMRNKSLAEWYPTKSASIVGKASCNMTEDEFILGLGMKLAVRRCMNQVVNFCTDKLMRLHKRLSAEEHAAVARIERNKKKKVVKQEQ